MVKNPRHLTYANVAATLALVFSMSGGALAADHYLITSTKQIAPKVLSKLKGNRGRTGPAGKTGPAGPTGATGATGPQGIPGIEGPRGAEGKEGKQGPTGLTALSEASSQEVNVEEGEAGAAFAECPTGEQPVSGGFSLSGPAPALETSSRYIEEEEGVTYTGWVFAIEAESGKKGPDLISASAYCSGEEGLTPARVSHAARRKITARVLAKARRR
jgi:hypothetical protein